MEEKDKNDQLIGKLIKKRKQENEAFFKLLNAIESKESASKQAKSTRSKEKE